MAVAPPRSLSPSKVAAFTDCALAFRFSAIDHLPEPPSPWATKGTLVHTALQKLLFAPPERRSVEAAIGFLAEAEREMADDPELLGLALDDEARAAFVADAEALIRRYFELEDPARVQPIGVELLMEADIGGAWVRGIIDRLELDADGELVVTDYKTGRAPNERFERGRLAGVHVYALLCEKLLGRRPARVQLLYLADPVAIICTPSERDVRAAERRLAAVWTAVVRACANESFRPKPSRLCDYCAFRTYCPAFGGDPDEGRRHAAELRARTRAEAAGQFELELEVPLALPVAGR
ncbi:MAG: RecB family exonuclease [Acidimicrobiales bacterium]